MGTGGDAFDMMYGWIGGRWVQVDVDGVPVLRERSSRCSRVDLVEGSGPDYIVWSRMVKGERALTSGTSGSSACGLRFLVPTHLSMTNTG
jgi:hypothetical protein